MSNFMFFIDLVNVLFEGWLGVVSDWFGDCEVFKVLWGKVMMWIFLLLDIFVFSSFLIGYMMVCMLIMVLWFNMVEVFGMKIGGVEVLLLLIVIMIFVFISSSGIMVMVVNFGYWCNVRCVVVFMLVMVLFGVCFVSL